MKTASQLSGIPLFAFSSRWNMSPEVLPPEMFQTWNLESGFTWKGSRLNSISGSASELATALPLLLLFVVLYYKVYTWISK